MMGGAPAAAGGKPKDPPSCSPPKNQTNTSTRLQTAAEMKNNFGFGKKDTNTYRVPCSGGDLADGHQSYFTAKENARARWLARQKPKSPKPTPQGRRPEARSPRRSKAGRNCRSPGP